MLTCGKPFATSPELSDAELVDASFAPFTLFVSDGRLLAASALSLCRARRLRTPSISLSTPGCSTERVLRSTTVRVTLIGNRRRGCSDVVGGQD